MPLKSFDGKLDEPSHVQPFDGLLDGEEAKASGGDVAKSFVQGAAEGVALPMQFGGNLVAQGVNRLARGAGVETNLRAVNPLGPVIEAIERSKTPGGRVTAERSQPTGDITSPSSWSFGSDPSVGGYAQNVARVAGQFAGPVVTAVGGRALKVGEKAIDTFAAAQGAAQAGGAAGGEEGEKIRTMPQPKIELLPAYRKYLAEGADPTTARERVAQDVELSAGVIGAVPGAIEGPVVQRLLRGKAMLPTVGKSAPARVASAAVSGAAGEAVQETAEQVAQNVGATLASGEDRAATADTFGAAVMGAAGGKLAGASIQTLREVGGKPAAEEKPAEVRKLFPFSSESAATRRAAAKSEQTGQPHVVIPHPERDGRFGVVPQSELRQFTPEATERMLADIERQGASDVAAGRDFPALAREFAASQEGGATPAPAGADAASQPRVADPSQVLATINATRGRPLADSQADIVQRMADGEFGDVQALTVDALVERGVKRGTAIAVLSPTQKAMDGLVTRRDSLNPVDRAAEDAATSPANGLPEPTDSQKEAGNYKKGHVWVQGLDLSIENPVGSTRSGVGPDGKPWQTQMQAHYGYIRGTKGADGAPIDVFTGPNIAAYVGLKPEGDAVFVVDQLDPQSGEFDEHKVLIGYESLEEARQGYLAHYEPGWQGLGAITQTTMGDFKTWTKNFDTSKPFGEAPAPTEVSDARAVEGAVADTSGAGDGSSAAESAAQPGGVGVPGTAAEGEARAAAAPEVPAAEVGEGLTFADVPAELRARIHATVQQHHEGEGVKSVEIPVEQALADIDEEIAAYEKLLQCVKEAA